MRQYSNESAEWVKKNILIEKHPFPDVRKSVVVARPENSNGLIIGPTESVLLIAESLKLLDLLAGERIHREMNFLVGPRFDSRAGTTNLYQDGLPYSVDLLRKLGIWQRISQSKFESPNPRSAYNYGVIPDTKPPLYITRDHSDVATYMSEDCAIIFWAANIVHEIQHIRQFAEGLPSYGLWSERHAMSAEADFFFKCLRSPMKFTTEEKNWLETSILWFSKMVYDYRNGRPMKNHLDPGFLEGSPVKDQRLHLIDFPNTTLA